MTVTDVSSSPVAGGTRDLGPLFNPKSVVIAGASDVPGKFGYAVARGALVSEHRRRVFLLNRGAETVAGRPAYRTFADLGEAPDLVVLATPAATVPDVVDEALAVGARAFLGLTAGITDDVEKAVAARIREAGAVLIGPNCIGLADAESELDLYAWGRFNSGSVAVLSHSGALGMDMARGVSDAGLGVSRIVSMGNCADLGPADMVRDLIDHEATRVIAVYCESLGDGRDFLRAAEEAREAGKPVVALVAEPTDATARAAMTHTRALLSDGRVVQAAYSAAGILQVHSIADMLDTVRVLAAPRRPRGRRIGVVSEGGGPGIMAADAMARAGLDVPEFSPALQERLGAIVHEVGSPANPVDIGSGGTVSAISNVAATVMESGEVDAVVITGLGSSSDFYLKEVDRSDSVVGRMIGPLPEAGELDGLRQNARNDHAGAQVYVDASSKTGVPAYGAFFDPALPTASIIEAGGSPVFRSVDSVARAVGLAVKAAEGCHSIPESLVAGEPLPDTDYFTVRQFLTEAGITFARASSVTSLEQAQAAAAELGYPVVLKALGSMHKSDDGGVALGLSGPEEIAEAFGRMAHIGSETYSVEEMVSSSGAVELILGAQVDHQFGPTVLVGMGGVYSELLDDVAVQLAPLDVDAAEQLIRSLRGISLLTGHRGRPAVALRAAAEALSRLSVVIARTPGIEDIEINPLLVTADGATGLDGRAVTSD
nr:acetate--CoA ligase family protein [Rhodococcus sp. (in: high G+C Gram-positive bacteria)]